jgi:hypothetical protein
MAKAGIFRPDLIELAIQQIGSNFSHIDDLTCSNALDKGRSLSAEEKRRFGLNVRRKYSDGFISFIDLQSTNGRCPNTIYRNLYMTAWFSTKRKIELARMRQSGVFKTVEILAVDDCSALRGKAKIYAIADTPALPLPGCDVNCCRCSYIVGI